MDVMEVVDLETDTVEVPEHVMKSSAEVRHRVRALKKLQLDALQLQVQFYNKVNEMEAEFAKCANAIHAKRAAIVNGQYEPTAEEASLPLLHVLDKDALVEYEREWDNTNPNKGETGVPRFWLNTLMGSATFVDMIQERDEPVLEHLVDISYSVDTSPQAFTLIFKFSPNNGYFTNTEVMKRYETSTALDDKDPFNYEGPYWVSVTSTDINWLPGKDVTKDSTGDLQESFFNFFKVNGRRDQNLPPLAMEELEQDYELGQLICDEIIPRAVLYYTGEVNGDDDSDFECDEEEDTEDEDSNSGDASNEEMDE
uniref:Nucleosome assembly protein n=1 Tax=Steinernema glaseri TaxID=37863 RepID=A0A1I8AFX2_9BILA